MIACALALVLLVDTSGSVSAERYALQHTGLAQALTDARVERGLLNQDGGVAVTVIEWSDRRQTVVPWRLIRSKDDVSAVAEILAGAQRSMTGSTAMGEAEAEGLDALDRAPCQATRKVMDVSGDGRNNDGRFAPDDVRVKARQHGVTINGLPILGDEPDVADYYRGHVITADGFVIEAKSYDDLAMAIRSKLMLEVSSR
ncbi:MAG: DUF1194 domain-containing protein [Acetobacteraceae bacterium]|nr:DUF1194 domain-containing protein [Acetobacteraceae bacterium]